MRVPALAAGILWILCAPLFATSVLPPSFDTLVAQADAVVRGEVTATRTELRERNGRPVPFTIVTLKVERTLIGEPIEQLELVLLGGKVGSRRVEVVGQPTFAAGDRDILFVQGNGRQLTPLVGMGHGRYLLVPDGPERTVVARSDGLPLAGVDQVSRPLHGSEHAGEARTALSLQAGLTVEAFEREILAAAERLGRTPSSR